MNVFQYAMSIALGIHENAENRRSLNLLKYIILVIKTSKMDYSVSAIGGPCAAYAKTTQLANSVFELDGRY